MFHRSLLYSFSRGTHEGSTPARRHPLYTLPRHLLYGSTSGIRTGLRLTNPMASREYLVDSARLPLSLMLLFAKSILLTADLEQLPMGETGHDQVGISKYLVS